MRCNAFPNHPVDIGGIDASWPITKVSDTVLRRVVERYNRTSNLGSMDEYLSYNECLDLTDHISLQLVGG